MIRYVIDASAAYEYLVRTPAGRRIEDTIHLTIPVTSCLMDVEVISVARRNLRLGILSEERARLMIESLKRWPIERIDARELGTLIWSLRDNFSAYDASYVSVAMKTGGTLLTLDGKLASAPKIPCPLMLF